MIYVEVWELTGGNAENRRTATVAWDGRRWLVNPPERTSVYIKPTVNHETQETVDPFRDPALFLQTLHENYRGTYYRIGRVKRGTPPPVTPAG